VTYRGYDISTTYLNLARQRLPGHSFSLLDIATELPQQKSDVSIISANLEHIDHWETALENILETTEQLVLMCSLFGMQPVSDIYKKHVLGSLTLCASSRSSRWLK
jgi:hypothetical protein